MIKILKLAHNIAVFIGIIGFQVFLGLILHASIKSGSDPRGIKIILFMNIVCAVIALVALVQLLVSIYELKKEDGTKVESSKDILQHKVDSK